MRKTAIALAMGFCLLTLVPGVGAAGPLDGKVVVVQVTAIDGLAGVDGEVAETFATSFAVDGGEFAIDRKALADLDGVDTLLLIDRRRDRSRSGTLTRTWTQEVRGVAGTYFEVTDLPGLELWYQVAEVDGKLGLLGDGSQILCPGGDDGPYHIWSIDAVNVVDRESVTLR